jgi:hypothetical protein
MPAVHKFVAAAVLSLLSASPFAATSVLTSAAAFQAQLAPGAYTNTFDGLGLPPFGPVPFSGGGFSYEVSAPSDIYLGGDLLSANIAGETLLITFTSGNITAIGANFFHTDDANAFQPASITLTLNDGTVETFSPTSAADSYRGFLTTGSAFSSIAISTSSTDFYASMDNLTVGAPVPEPASLSLVLAGLAVVGVYASRRRAV